MYLQKYISPKNYYTMFHYVVVAFNQSSYSFGPVNKGKIVPFPITTSYSGTNNYDVRVQVNHSPDPLPSKHFVKIRYYIIVCVDGGRFIRRFSNNDIQYTPSTTSHNFTMTLADSGNQVALEDALSFTLVVSVTSSSFSGFTVIVLSSPNVIIADLDGE